MNSPIKFKIICILLTSTSIIFTVNSEKVKFTPCKERISTAKNIQVEINKCNETSDCSLSRGEQAELILKFTPSKDSSAEVERLIVAQIPSSKNKLIEVPYAGTIDIINSTFFEKDGRKFVYPIRKSNMQLVHKYVFPVMEDSSNTPISMRFIIREKGENMITNQRNWRRHPGAMIVCVNIRLDLKSLE